MSSPVVPLAADDSAPKPMDTSMDVENSATRILQEEESNPIISSDEVSLAAVAQVHPVMAEDDEKMEEDHEQAVDKKTDEETTTTSLNDVYQALDSLDSEGCACTGGLASELPSMPGLVVEGVGKVKLPIDPEIASRLQSVSSGMCYQEVGDILVPVEATVEATDADMTQIDAERVTVTNPVWSAGLKALTKRVCTALGVDPDLVRMELSNLLLNQESDCSKKHRDLKKVDGKFASLMVQLPSHFTGGSFGVTYNGNTKTFSMQDPETCPFSCQFVAHYADCEHAILPIKSGHQLVLVYSLCYIGSESSKPSLANVKEGSLGSVMQKLDKGQSLFAIPIDHQYESMALAQHGVDALKGKDRCLARTIVRVEGWDIVIVKADGLDMNSNFPGMIFFRELFDPNGRDAKSHQKWLEKELSFWLLKNGGNVLANEDEAKAMCEVEDSTDPTHYSYRTCILIAFSTHAVFEQVCRSDFSKALEEVQKNPNLLDRVLEFMKTSKPILYSKNFLILYSLMEGKSMFWLSLDAMMEGLSKNKREVPSFQVISILATLIKENGWNDERIAPIRFYLEEVTEASRMNNCMDLLTLIEHFLTIKKVVHNEKTVLETLIEQTVHNFDKRSRYSVSGSISPSRRGEIYKRLESLALCHGYASISSAAKACFVRIRKVDNMKTWNYLPWAIETETLLPTLVEQMEAVESMHTNVPGAKHHTSLEESILDAFSGMVKHDWLCRINFSKELPTIHAFLKNHSSYWSTFNAMLQERRWKWKLPCSSFTSILASVIQEHGWDDEKMGSVRLVLEQLPDIAQKCDCMKFLELIEQLLLLKTTLEDKAPIDSLIERTIENFNDDDADEGRGRMSSKTRKAIYSLLEKRVKEHGWESLSATVEACFLRLHKLVPCDEEAWLEIFLEQIDWVKSLRTSKRLETSIVDSFERVVKNEILDSLEGVTWNYSQTKLTSSNRFTTLHSYFKHDFTYWNFFEEILERLDNESKPPPSNLTSILASTIQERGWLDYKVAPIRQFLEQLAEKGSNVNCIDFLTFLEVLFSLRKLLELRAPIQSLIGDMICNFEWQTEQGQLLRMYFTNENPKEIYKRLEKLGGSDARDVSRAINVCFVRIRKINERKTIFEHMHDQIKATESIATHVADVEKDDLQEPILTEFVSSLTSGRLWDASGIQRMLEKLVMYGTTKMFEDVKTWAHTASSSRLRVLDSAFQKLSSTSHNMSNADYIEECVTYVRTRARQQKVTKLKNQERQLVSLTEDGPPVFSWRIPNANTGNDSLDAFLQSSRPGPLTICVGGGIGHARSVARNGSIMSQDYADEIGVYLFESQERGNRASVMVFKTKRLHDTQLARYESNVEKLANVRAQLERLGRRPRERAEEEPPTKRRKV